jgi:hypothetical protein
MISSDGLDSKSQTPVLVEKKSATESAQGAPPLPGPAAFATRGKTEVREQLVRNKSVLLLGAAFAFAFTLFLISSRPHKNLAPEANKLMAGHQAGASQTNENPEAQKSTVPVFEASTRPVAKDSHDGALDEQDLQRTAGKQGRVANPTETIPQGGTLGSIPPFGGDNGSWQAPPYQVTANNGEPADQTPKKEQDQASLVFVQKVTQTSNNPAELGALDSAPGLGLVTGSRLRARLEATASTAVRTPVIAVIEYNYQKNGEIVVPAGAKVFGHIEQADRSGYLSIRFDSLMMPDGSSSTLDAVATDLSLKPLRGRVEGKNSGKNALVRSLSGIGQVGALLAGRSNSLNQPFSEGDLLRERLSNNIGQSTDQELAQLSVTEHIVVSISANTPIYVVLDRGTKQALARPDQFSRGVPPASQNVESLRQLLQLQRELNQTADASAR